MTEHLAVTATSPREGGDDPTPGAPSGTLERGLHLLGLFTSEEPEWTLRQLREESQLAKATVRRLMLTLERLGWVTQDQVSGAYTLGPRIMQCLYAKTSLVMLAGVARPHLERLASETTESTVLNVWGHDGPLTVDLVTTPRHFKPFTATGMTMQGLATADAQVLTAFSPESVWDARYTLLLDRTNGLTEADRARVRDRWREVRRSGIAFDREEWKPGVCAVAAPILDDTGSVLASLSVVFPSERASDRETERYAVAVRDAAVAISRALRAAEQ
jgi:DNA-binding IclR family transcriptional regulator